MAADNKNIAEEVQGLEIRTMRKDIAWIQSGGRQMDKEKMDKYNRQERQKRIEEERKKKREACLSFFSGLFPLLID